MRLWISAALILTTLSACGPSATTDRETRRVQEQNLLADRLNKRGVPVSAWTDTDLNAFERDLNRLVRVDGGRNRVYIANMRTALAEARAKKANATTAQTSAPADAAARLARYQTAYGEFHTRSQDPSVHQTPEFKRELNQLITMADELEASSAFDEIQKVKIRSSRTALLEVRREVEHTSPSARGTWL